MPEEKWYRPKSCWRYNERGGNDPAGWVGFGYKYVGWVYRNKSGPWRGLWIALFDEKRERNRYYNPCDYTARITEDQLAEHFDQVEVPEWYSEHDPPKQPEMLKFEQVSLF